MEDVIVVALEVMPPTLLHNQLFDQTSQLVANLIFSPLIIPNDTKNKSILDSVSSSNGYDWFVEIKRNQFWPDGEKLTTKHITESFRYFFDHNASSFMSWLRLFFLNDDNVNNRQSLSIKVIDDHTFIIQLSKKCSFFPKLLQLHAFAPIRYSPNDCPEILPANYSIYSLLPNQKGFILKLNASSPTSESGRSEAINLPSYIILVVHNQERDVLKLFSVGKLHLTCNTTFPFELIPKFENTDFFIRSPLKMVFQLAFNAKNKNFNTAFRKAIFWSINKAQISDELNSFVAPLTHYTELWANESSQSKVCYQGDKVKAQEHFRESGIEGKLSIAITYPNFHPNSEIVSKLIIHITNCLPIANIIPRCLAYDDYVKSLVINEFDIALIINPANYDDASSLMVPLLSLNKCTKPISYSNETFDQQLIEAMAVDDEHQRLLAYRAANDTLLEDMPVVPLFRANNIYLNKNEELLRYTSLGLLEWK